MTENDQTSQRTKKANEDELDCDAKIQATVQYNLDFINSSFSQDEVMLFQKLTISETSHNVPELTAVILALSQARRKLIRRAMRYRAGRRVQSKECTAILFKVVQRDLFPHEMPLSVNCIYDQEAEAKIATLTGLSAALKPGWNHKKRFVITFKATFA